MRLRYWTTKYLQSWLIFYTHTNMPPLDSSLKLNSHIISKILTSCIRLKRSCNLFCTHTISSVVPFFRDKQIVMKLTSAHDVQLTYVYLGVDCTPGGYLT